MDFYVITKLIMCYEIMDFYVITKLTMKLIAGDETNYG